MYRGVARSSLWYVRFECSRGGSALVGSLSGRASARGTPTGDCDMYVCMGPAPGVLVEVCDPQLTPPVGL